MRKKNEKPGLPQARAFCIFFKASPYL